VNEETLLSFTASATDADSPANTLTYSLTGMVPSGAAINSSTGTLTWTPTEAQGPGNYNFTVKVTDSGTGNLTDEESITVTVNDENIAPTLDALPDLNLQANPGAQTVSLSEIGGKMVELTAQITTTTSSGSSTTEKIDGFSEPVAVTIDLSNLGVLPPEHIAKLTAVRFEKDAAGNITPVRLGGTYDPATRTFTFYTDRFSLYSVLRADKITNINLTLNNVVAKVNGASRALDVAPKLINNRTGGVRFTSTKLKNRAEHKFRSAYF